MNVEKIMPTTWLLIAIVAVIAFHSLLPVATVVPPLWNLLGSIPLALGVIINLVADRAFHRARTTVKPFEESCALITRGAVRSSRNPMYVGFVLILVGIAVLVRTLTPYAVVVASAISMDRMHVAVEERMLAETFGANREAYRRRTVRWI